MTTASPGLRDRLQGWIPPSYREMFQRVASGVLMLLTGYQLLDSEKAALWGQLALGTISAIFALLYATSSARVVLYALVGPVGGILMAYGLINDVKWAVLVASVGQVFGTATAAAKVVELVPAPTNAVVPSKITTSEAAPVTARVAVAVSSPREASAIRRHRRATKRPPAKGRRGDRVA
jgi:hypothetical protein